MHTQPSFRTASELKSYFNSHTLVVAGTSIRSARTTSQVVGELLFENEPVPIQDLLHYFAFLDLGMGVFLVKPRPNGCINNFIVTEFEAHRPDDHNTGYFTVLY